MHWGPKAQSTPGRLTQAGIEETTTTQGLAAAFAEEPAKCSIDDSLSPPSHKHQR